MDTTSKVSWPVVKFLIAATGTTRDQAREMIPEIPKEKYTLLMLRAVQWDREMEAGANRILQDLLGEEGSEVLAKIVDNARKASGTHDEEQAPPKKARKRRSA